MFSNPKQQINESPNIMPSPNVSDKQSANGGLNSMKVVEMIHLEGCFRIRKIFSSRSVIPNEVNTDVYGSNEDIFGTRVEPVPKNFDYIAGVSRVNQVLSFDTVIGFTERKMSSIEDSMMVTGLRMTGAQ